MPSPRTTPRCPARSTHSAQSWSYHSPGKRWRGRRRSARCEVRRREQDIELLAGRRREDRRERFASQPTLDPRNAATQCIAARAARPKGQNAAPRAGASTAAEKTGLKILARLPKGIEHKRMSHATQLSLKCSIWRQRRRDCEWRAGSARKSEARLGFAHRAENAHAAILGLEQALAPALPRRQKADDAADLLDRRTGIRGQRGRTAPAIFHLQHGRTSLNAMREQPVRQGRRRDALRLLVVAVERMVTPTATLSVYGRCRGCAMRQRHIRASPWAAMLHARSRPRDRCGRIELDPAEPAAAPHTDTQAWLACSWCPAASRASLPCRR